MKRRSIVFISLVLAIVLCVPSVPVLADGVNVPGYYTKSCMAEVFSGEELEDFQSIYNLSDGDFTQELFNYFNSLDLSSFTSYFIFSYGSNTTLIGYDSTVAPIYSLDLNSGVTLIFPVDAVGGGYATTYTYNTVTHEGVSGQEIFSRLNNDALSYSFYYTNLVGYPTGPLSVVYYSGIEGLYDSSVQNSFDQHYGYVDHGLTNYYVEGLPYYDGTNIVDPDAPVSENNTNHLYLTGCDAGFTKPLSLNNLNSSGGGYVYFTYNFDDWINNHSGDYTLQCNSTFYINNSSTGSIVRRNLDVSGVSIFALSELGDFVDWQNLNTTFMGYPNQVLTGNYIKGYVYSLTYNQFGILQERYAKAGAHTVGYWVVKFANMLPGVKITENNVNYQEYFNSVVPSRFDLKVSFKIIDNVSGEESGTYSKTFNMLTGVSNVDSNSIQDNENPYVPSNTDDLQLPSIGDNNNGYLIETGDNNQIVNLTTPDNIKLFIDNGFQNFLSWYETSADTAYATNRFWSSMGIFEGNPATELYSEYFGFLPDDFKTLIFSCAGIGIVGGAFCILRRRLH